MNPTAEPLDKALRRKLERAVVQAREEATAAARAAIHHLGVGEAKAPGHLVVEQKTLRRRLRAHGRQAGDARHPDGRQDTRHLADEMAYEHWHRMLFGRFLAESNLLMHPDGVPVSLQDCVELAPDEGAADGWELAGRYAARMLPQIFRPDSPALALKLAPEDQRALEKLLEGLEPEVFTAGDALGWVYQFWQTAEKERVNKSEVKIGADELPAVTQLFTEPYMVSFLLDNALGAWWAARRLTDEDLHTAKTEDELRRKAAIPGVPLEYLRFVRTQADPAEGEAAPTPVDAEGPNVPLSPANIIPSPPRGEGQGEGESNITPSAETSPAQGEEEEQPHPWTPAAGTFDAWPQHLGDLKVMDPCCGSGHFLVAAFHMLVPMRMALEGLDAAASVDAVLRDNLHGLELDPRCVEIAAFALALAAWRFPGGGGYRTLPRLNLACSGLGIHAKKSEWLGLAKGEQALENALGRLYDLFRHGPTLGSLVDPRSVLKNDIFGDEWSRLSSILETALQAEDEDLQELGVTARGLADAAILLAARYMWVVTNVPYLSQVKQNEVLKIHLETFFPTAKGDIATAFIQRIIAMLECGGISCLVSPQNWLFQPTYKRLRTSLLTSEDFRIVIRLGPGAFDAISGEVVKPILLVTERRAPTEMSRFLSIDLSAIENAEGKALRLKTVNPLILSQVQQLENPDSRIVTGQTTDAPLLSAEANAWQGICTGDYLRFGRFFWEFPYQLKGWDRQITTVSATIDYGGRTSLFRWDNGSGEFVDYLNDRLGESHGAWVRGLDAWGKKGVVISQTNNLATTLYTGEAFDNNAAVMVPINPAILPALWSYCSSDQYHVAVREIDQALKVTNKTLIKVPFDLESYDKIATEKYPHGLPPPYCNAPGQWIFHGHPCGSVIWDEETRWTAHGTLRTDDTVLQVAVARLLDYRWPAESDEDMELSKESREWVARCTELNAFADDDGIVCIPTVRGEKPAAERLMALLQAAYSQEWTANTLGILLTESGAKGKSLEWWLRERFFEQHCKLFQHRPFIWHIWDGLKDGFTALVNYHKLDRKHLESLVYTYLGDWVGLQEAAVREGEDGAQLRLDAARNLKKRLELILEGEPPYDIFVRWKPREEQPVGWAPDLNDGVRLNIRPFMTAEVLRHYKKPKLNIHWNKDRGRDVPSAPWYHLGPEYGGKAGDRINDHHLSVAEKRAAREAAKGETRN